MGIDGRYRNWALPALDGYGLRAFLVLWILLLGAAVGSSIAVMPDIVAAVERPTSSSQALGIQFHRDLDRPTIQIADASAFRAGVRSGDRIIQVDDRPAAPNIAGLERQLDGPTGSAVEIVTSSIEGRLGRHRLIRDPERYAKSLHQVGLTPALYGLLATGLQFLVGEAILIACAVVLMVRRLRDPVAPWASVMMLFTVLGASSAGNWFATQFGDPLAIYYLCNGLASAMTVVMLAVFPTGRFDPVWSLPIAVIGVAAVVVATPMPNAVTNSTIFVAQLMAVAAIVARYRSMAPGVGRQQIRWAILGFVISTIGLLLGALCQFAESANAQVGIDAWLRIGQVIFFGIANSAMVLAITVSLIRYRLYSVDATISRSIVYGALTVGLLASFAASEKLIEILGEEYFGARLGTLASVLAAAVAATLIAPIHHRVTHWTEKRFRSGLVSLRRGLPLLVGDLRETASPHALAAETLRRVETGVRASCAAIVVDGTVLDARDIEPMRVVEWFEASARSLTEQQGLQSDRVDPVFPVRVALYADGPGYVGWLLLGPRPDGSFYGRDEKEALQDIADPLARALAVSLERERRDVRQAENDSAVRRELRELREMLLSLANRSDGRTDMPRSAN